MNIFSSAHAYADILVNAKLLSDNEPHENNAVHALNTRIHNNALCGLLYEGSDFSIEESERGRYIRIEYNNNIYEIPENTVKNILRGDFDKIVNRKAIQEIPVEENKSEDKETAAVRAIEEEAPVETHTETSNVSKEAATEITDAPAQETITEIVCEPVEEASEVAEKENKEEVTEGIDNIEAVSETNNDKVPEKNEKDVHEEKNRPVIAKLSKKKMPKKQASFKRGIIDDEHAFTISPDLNHVTIYVKEEVAEKEESSTAVNESDSEEKEENQTTSGFSAFSSMLMNEAEIANDTDDEDIVETPSLSEKSNDIKDDAEEKTDNSSDVKTLPPRGFFKKKVQTETVAEETQVEEVSAEKKAINPVKVSFFKKAGDKQVEKQTDEKKDEEKKSIFGFAPKKPKLNTEKEEVVPEEIKIPKLELFDEEVEENHSQDNGELFNHIHNVVLRRRFGSVEEGPYRFIIWPTWIFDKTSGSGFAEILVHVTDPEDNEYVFVTQKHENDLDIKINNKTFKVYGTWKSGVFVSHVVLTDKTASVYEAVDDVKKNIPKNVSNMYLDQFRLEKRGYPSLFVVPFKNYNGGEKYIPIVGCVELNGARTVLPRRPMNELRYSFGGIERVVRGFWKDGEFTFTSDDANRMLLITEAV